jgi:two-component system chemotaxis response regulator CheB
MSTGAVSPATGTPAGPPLVMVGASLGGLRALGAMLEAMGGPIGCPIVVVLHRGSGTSDLARHLGRHTSMPVGDVEDKDPIVAGRIHLAPPGYHLLVQADGFALSTEAPVRYSRPSIDVTFESAADAFAERVVGVILTGGNDDGRRGLERVVRRGGYVVVQDPATAADPTMPQAVIDHVAVDAVLSLEAIGGRLVELCGLSELV